MRGLPDVELRVALHRLGELVVALDRGVVLEHVQDESLLDGLLHAVVVEGAVADGAVALRVRIAENLQSLVLGGGGEGIIARVGEQLARLHEAVDLVLVSLLLLLHFARLSQCAGHGRAGLTALAGMCLVDDDGKSARALLVAYLVQDEGKLLDGGNDDLLALFDEPAQVARTLGVSHGRAYLSVLPDRVADLLVQDAAVGDDDDGIEDGLAVLFQRDHLMRQPGDGKALAAAGRVLDQVAPARPVLARVGQQLSNHIELVVARPDLDPFLSPRLRVLGLQHLGVVLQDVGHAGPCKDLAPEVVRAESVRVGRIAGAIVPATVEGQEPRRLPL